MYPWLFSKAVWLSPKESLKTSNKPIKLICIFTKFQIANIGNLYIFKEKKHLFNGYLRIAGFAGYLRNYLILTKPMPRQGKSRHTHQSIPLLALATFTVRPVSTEHHAPLTPASPRPDAAAWHEMKPAWLRETMYTTASIPDS